MYEDGEEGIRHSFNECLSELFDEASLDLIVNLLANQFDSLKMKLNESHDYLEKSRLIRELQLTEAELIRFRNIRPIRNKIISQPENMSLDDFNI